MALIPKSGEGLQEEKTWGRNFFPPTLPIGGRGRRLKIPIQCPKSYVEHQNTYTSHMPVILLVDVWETRGI
jgi:hypothetical protein